jgi:hypothetical protein
MAELDFFKCAARRERDAGIAIDSEQSSWINPASLKTPPRSAIAPPKK